MNLLCKIFGHKETPWMFKTGNGTMCTRCKQVGNFKPFTN